MSARAHIAAAARSGLIGSLAIIAFALSFCTRAASAVPPSTSSAGLTSHFVIADFDGDRQPDFATVEIQNGSSSDCARYSIRFRLTAGAAQSFGVSAPVGGLQIVARDVNGDNALDLLVSTAWLHKQVAVLLNDGHGNFTLAKPDAFSSSLWDSSDIWNTSASTLEIGAALIRSENSSGEPNAHGSSDRVRPRSALQRSPVSSSRDSLLLFSLLGRAPPSFFLQS